MADNNQLLNVQPHSEEAELAVLGSMLSSKEAVSKSIQWLTPDVFYKDAHGKIFSAMELLFDKGEPVDTVSVIDLLKKNKELESVGGTYFVTGLVESVPTAAHVERYSKIVMEKALLRSLITLSHSIAKEAYEDSQDVADILDTVEQSIFSITQNRLKGGFTQINDIVVAALEKLELIRASGGSVIGVPSGLLDLDDITSGFQEGDLIIIAGRPGMGKTALALSMIRNAALEADVGVGMFSLEMANHQLAMRLLCAEARVDSHFVRTGKLPAKLWKNLGLSAGDLEKAPIYLDDSPALTVLELRAKARRLKAEHNIGMIVVDYLQLMQGPRGVENRQQEISVISRSLKALAKELSIPVVALSQLSRAVEQRADRKPQLSDLRESGAIEQDADVVIFLYRPWVYSQEDEDEGKAEIIVAKQRNGPTGHISASFISKYARFENLSQAETPF
ncbi:MAG: replicative DNA helicase [Candidatus Marinimicrobia bacterium]|jgi:replicative DNA helicase|nr:replicative DNA helicase [Candidatus Neomarinimicrobiota bacterium]MCS5646737.1 replicative DNA helicase [Candidatus Neomarinimicrobiota bacterium]MEC7745538.1 replicative DNA helicase [Candidatus Neomarinimicrobiota bacterium]MEE3153249.1 replicative DNA helicase [Candidatus Neomarinimicrobiota bacterium]|tara:strand:- start:10733 stop:12079 length:1347 start_codon:yes stop_codon:yes gene_type:complete